MTPLTPQQIFANAVEHHKAGRLAAAAALYEQVLQSDPDHADALHLLGAVTYRLGKPIEAALFLRRAIALRPDFSDAWNSLANTLRASGQLDAAIEAYHKAIEFRPDNAEAFSNLGNALAAKGDLDASIAAHQKAVQLKPDLAGVHSNLASVLHEDRRLREAIDAYRTAIALDSSSSPAAHVNLGNALKEHGLLADALHQYARAIEINPNLPEAHSDRGAALKESGDIDAAIESCRKAISLRPDFPAAFCNLANSLKESGQIDKAIAAYEKAFLFDPKFHRAHSNLLLAIHYHPDYDAPAILREHKKWAYEFADRLTPRNPQYPNDRSPDRPLRIGFVSLDFRDHVVGRHLLPLLRNLDKKAFEVFCYSDLVQPADPVTAQLQQRAHHWRQTPGQTDAQLADLIYRDQIDVLIDLTLHSAGTRLLTFAQKPAPIQATWLGYCSTTGLSTMDYRLSDPHFDPPGTDTNYSEQTLRLPHTYWCYEPSGKTPNVAPTPALANGRIRFGCLNNFAKLSPPTIALWAQILNQTPTSELVIQSAPGSHRQKLLERFAQLGITNQRISFVPRVSWSNYMQTYNTIDIALDPTPFNGGITTMDALWMGVPVITLSGQTAVGRAGRSILSNIGLPELIASTPDEYIKIATDLAADRPRLQSLRASVRTKCNPAR